MLKKSKKVVVAGHICLDITPNFSSDKVGKLQEVLMPGKLINVEQADIHTGGAVANTGLGMKILGADVKLIGKIGQDSFGKLVLDILDEYDASAGMISSPNVSTSYSIVITPPGVDRIFLHNPGANDTFQANDIKDDMLEDVSMFHFGYPTLMKNIYQNEGEELLKIFKKIKELNIATSLDMAAIDATSEAGKVDWTKILERVLPYVDFFVPSVEELCFMLDREKYEEWIRKADGNDITSILSINNDVKPLADKLMNMGAKVVLVKCGAPGLYYRTAEKSIVAGIGSNLNIDLESWANREGFEESYEPEKVISGTGAGDTSIAAFLTAILSGGYTFEKCIQLAVATGASCVSEYDALSGLESFEKIEKKINDGWKKQHLLKENNNIC
ncbi:sugar kinase [Clostridium beijerinckii]|uniref:Sugar kinase n=1 Tax=Clostridium beijerinckii TaxID=1520 RepID=A0A0B5QBB7_CLOBE|nr:carbohydrate kinase family protein [Clostridium beijerinckii]AJG98215.1 sugar kinase [Clostridium beijerinckii]